MAGKWTIPPQVGASSRGEGASAGSAGHHLQASRGETDGVIMDTARSHRFFGMGMNEILVIGTADDTMGPGLRHSRRID